MKRFILHAILFIIVFCLVQVTINTLFLKDLKKPYYHNKLFASQFEHYLSRQDTFNALFLGSSRTYRQLNPAIIDQELARYHIKSYNLGASATFIPETFYLLEEILEHQSKKPVRYLFFELSGIYSIKFVNWFSPHSYYYLDWQIVRLVFNTYFDNPGLHWGMAWIYTYPYIQGYILKYIVPLNLLPEQSGVDIYSRNNQNGYYPKDLEVKQYQTKKLIGNNMELLKDTTILMERRMQQLRRKGHTVSQDYSEYLNHLVRKADQKGVKLFFVLPPKLKDYQSMKNLTDSIHDNRVIDMGSPDEFPIFNLVQYNFDVSHLNSEGADLYSTYLAEKIRKKLELSILNHDQ